MPIIHRAEHVGSFLRPAAVLEARQNFKDGKINDAELRKVEDEAIAQVVKEQYTNGLKSISDGEFRRDYFHLDFLKHLGGVTITTENEGSKDHFKPPTLAVTGKLEHVKPIQVDDYKFLQQQIDANKYSDAVVKVAIPSPTMVHFRGGRASIDINSYPELDVFFEDLAKVFRQEIDALYKAGCRFVQLDDTNLAYLCDQKMREAAAGRGEDLNALPRQYAKLINETLKDVPSDMTIGIHLCRGNFRSRSFAEGGYEPIAEVLFRELNVHVYFLEFDDDRSGNFEPLRFVPPGKTVVLGVVSSKIAQLEDKQHIINRIKEAAKYMPLEQISLSAQCGFSSTSHGNDLTIEEQWKKVQLISEISKEIWGN